MSANKLLSLLVSLVVLMLALSYAFVPLYSLFCKATGYLGSVDRALKAPDVIGSKLLNVYFNADVSPGLDWKFYPERNRIQLKTGSLFLAFFYAENNTDKAVDGIAVYNVTPYKVAKYFKKVACFCFEKQTLPPKTKVVMPVSFFIDPAFDLDKEVNYIDAMTLSYTFFEY